MDCKKVRGLIVEYIDGELAIESRNIVKAHLGICDKCGRLEVSLRRVAIEPFKDAERRKVPEELWNNVEEGIRGVEKTVSFTGLMEKIIAPLGIKRPALAFVAATMLLLFTIVLIRQPIGSENALSAYMEEESEFFYPANGNGEAENPDSVANFGTSIEEILL
ncbi:MAG: zf-HC2 domain-containing protein [Candidatus Omnitrophota bacterium]